MALKGEGVCVRQDWEGAPGKRRLRKGGLRKGGLEKVSWRKEELEDKVWEMKTERAESEQRRGRNLPGMEDGKKEIWGKQDRKRQKDSPTEHRIGLLSKWTEPRMDSTPY